MQVLISESKNDELNKSDLDKQWHNGACFVHEYTHANKKKATQIH